MRCHTRLPARASAGLVLAGVFAVSTARADTEEGFYYSDDAALNAGAVVASTHDAGAVWYNPAGLGGQRRTQLSLNGTIYALKIRKLPQALRTRFPGAGQRGLDITSTDIMSAPHATALVFGLGKDVSLGLGVYISERDVRTASSTLQFTQPAGPELAQAATFREHLDVALELTKYSLGPAIGWQIAPGLRVGASAFLTYTKRIELAFFEVDTAVGSGPSPIGYVLGYDRRSSNELGVVGMLGVQWEPSRTWSLGLTLRAPELRVHHGVDGAGISASASVGGVSPAEAAIDLDRPTEPSGVGIRVPPRVVIGAAHAFAERVIVSAEADFLPAVSSAATGVTTRNIVNVRAGVRALLLGDRLSGGLGVFSDRDRVVLGPDLANERVDRYGVTAGLQLDTPFTVRQGEQTVPAGIVLTTTLAMRYAAGIGEVRGLDLDAIDGGMSTRVFDVLYHEFTPYIGSAVTF